MDTNAPGFPNAEWSVATYVHGTQEAVASVVAPPPQQEPSAETSALLCPVPPAATAAAAEPLLSSPQRKEKWALYCLYRSTDGPAWACSEGWRNLFEADLSSLYGVSTDKGRVTKISLGANNLDGESRGLM